MMRCGEIRYEGKEIGIRGNETRWDEPSGCVMCI